MKEIKETRYSETKLEPGSSYANELTLSVLFHKSHRSLLLFNSFTYNGDKFRDFIKINKTELQVAYCFSYLT